ncbi:hypothetical protein GCM10018966_063030 [Streptomyces yanii]
MAAAASDRRMPSLTVVVSSDTDICFSPGLYGLLADVATVGTADSFRAERLPVPFMLAHPSGKRCRAGQGLLSRPRNSPRPPPEGIRHIDAIGIVKVT